MGIFAPSIGGVLYQLNLKLPGLPKIVSNGPHGDWRVRAARVRTIKHNVVLVVGQDRPEIPLQRAKIIFTRHSSLEPDFDNLVISFKAVLDGLRLAGVISDDKRVNVGRPEYLWKYAPRNKGFVTVEVSEITDDELACSRMSSK